MAGKTPAKRGPSRPIKYTEELADQICELIAQDWSIKQIGARDDMPHEITILRWMQRHDEFASKCARARETQADYVAGTLAELEQQTLDGVIAPDAARVVIGSRQWRAGRMAPKRWGDKQTIAHEGALEVQHSGLTPESRLEKLKELAQAHPELLAKLAGKQ
jgi:hypothetical protein